MNFGFESPRREADYRHQKPPVAGVMNFRCKKCGKAIFSLQGRKRVYRGWHCASCAGGEQ